MDSGSSATYAQTSSIAGLTINGDGSWTFDAGSYDSLAAGVSQVLTASYSVTDNNNASATNSFSITVTGVNDVATLTSDTKALTESDAVLSTSGTLTLSDRDSTPATVISQTGTSGTYGNFSNNSTGIWSYTTNDALNQLNANQAVTEVFSVATTDGGSAVVTINITGTNDTPETNNNSFTIDETAIHTFMRDIFNFNDVDFGSGLSKIMIKSLPGNGALLLNGNAITSSQLTSQGGSIAINIEDIGNLQYKLNGNDKGASVPAGAIDFAVVDTEGGVSISKNIAINITGRNSTPVLTITPQINFNENADAFNQTVNAEGELTFKDANPNDTISLTISYNGDFIIFTTGANGERVPSATKLSNSTRANLINGLKLEPAAITNGTSGTNGTAKWIYQAEDLDLDALQDGEIAEFTYTLEGTDSRSATGEETIKIVIYGYNNEDYRPINVSPIAETINEGSTHAAFEVNTYAGQNIKLAMINSEISEKQASLIYNQAEGPADISNKIEYWDKTKNQWITYDPLKNNGYFTIGTASNEVNGDATTLSVRVGILNDDTTKNPPKVEGNEALTLQVSSTGNKATGKTYINDEGVVGGGVLVNFEQSSSDPSKPTIIGPNEENANKFDNDNANILTTSNDVNFTIYKSEGKISGSLPATNIDKDTLKFDLLGDESGETIITASSQPGLYSLKDSSGVAMATIKLISSTGKYDLILEPSYVPEENQGSRELNFRFQITESYDTDKSNVLIQNFNLKTLFIAPAASPSIINVSEIDYGKDRTAQGDFLPQDITPNDFLTLDSTQDIELISPDARKPIGFKLYDKNTGALILSSATDISRDKPDIRLNAQGANGATDGTRGWEVKINLSESTLEQSTYSLRLTLAVDATRTIDTEMTTDLIVDGINQYGGSFSLGTTPSLSENQGDRVEATNHIYGTLSIISKQREDLTVKNLEKTGSILVPRFDASGNQIIVNQIPQTRPGRWVDGDGEEITFGVIANPNNSKELITQDSINATTTLRLENGSKITVNNYSGTYDYDFSQKGGPGFEPPVGKEWPSADKFTLIARDPQGGQSQLILTLDSKDPKDGDGQSTRAETTLQSILANLTGRPEPDSAEETKSIAMVTADAAINQLLTSSNPAEVEEAYRRIQDNPTSIIKLSASDSESSTFSETIQFSGVNITETTTLAQAYTSDKKITEIRELLEANPSLGYTSYEDFFTKKGYSSSENFANSLSLPTSVNARNFDIIGFTIESLESISELGEDGNPKFRDANSSIRGIQVLTTIDLRLSEIRADEMVGYQKFVSVENYINYEGWLKSLPIELQQDNKFFTWTKDNNGTLIKQFLEGPGWYDFYQYDKTMGGASFAYSEPINGVKYLQSITLTISDNQFGDFALEYGKDWQSGDGRIEDPGLPTTRAVTPTPSPTPTTLSLGVFEVANSDTTSPIASPAEQSADTTLAATASELETVEVIDQGGNGGEEMINKEDGGKVPSSTLQKELRQQSRDGLREWAKSIGLLQDDGTNTANSDNGRGNGANDVLKAPMAFMADKLGINPSMGEGLVNAMVLGAASLYILKAGGGGVLSQWATAFWSQSTKKSAAGTQYQRVIAVFLMRSHQSLDRLIAAEIRDDNLEILVEEKLPISLNAAANWRSADFEYQIKSLCMKLENQGVSQYDLLLCDPEIKSYLTILEHLGRDSDELEPERLRNVVKSLEQEELGRLEAWIEKPSRNALNNHPVAEFLKKRQEQLSKQLPKDKAMITSLLELSLAIAQRNQSASLI